MEKTVVQIFDNDVIMKSWIGEVRYIGMNYHSSERSILEHTTNMLAAIQRRILRMEAYRLENGQTRTQTGGNCPIQQDPGGGESSTDCLSLTLAQSLAFCPFWLNLCSYWDSSRYV